jgi:hypothetical protein
MKQQRCGTWGGGIHLHLESGMQDDRCKWFYAAQPNRKCHRPIVGYYGDRQSGRTYCAEHLSILAERMKPEYKPSGRRWRAKNAPKRGRRGGGWGETVKMPPRSDDQEATCDLIRCQPGPMLQVRARMRGQTNEAR